MPETVLAVPVDTLLVLKKEKAEEILELIKKTPTLTKEEKKARAKRVKALYTKPGGSNETILCQQ